MCLDRETQAVILVCELAMPFHLEGEPFYPGDYVQLREGCATRGFPKDAFRSRYLPVLTWEENDRACT